MSLATVIAPSTCLHLELVILAHASEVKALDNRALTLSVISLSLDRQLGVKDKAADREEEAERAHDVVPRIGLD